MGSFFVLDAGIGTCRTCAASHGVFWQHRAAHGTTTPRKTALVASGIRPRELLFPKWNLPATDSYTMFAVKLSLNSLIRR